MVKQTPNASLEVNVPVSNSELDLLCHFQAVG
jgi:hypothetical protein